MKKIFLGIVLVIALVIVAYGLINVMSTTDPATAAVIETEIPMLTVSNIGASLNGGLTITGPNVPGHWETEHSYFTDSNKVQFCPIETVGIQKFVFIPDDPNIKASSVHSVVFVWRAYIVEMVLVLIVITLIIAIYINTKTNPSSQEGRKVTIT